MRRHAPTLVLVRHGQTEWSATGRHTGVTDVPLDDAGRRTAGRLPERLAGWDFALVLASPRAGRVNRCAGRPRRAVYGIDEDPGGCEFDYGAYGGRTTPRSRGAPGLERVGRGRRGGETAAEVGVRADRVIERALAAGGDVAVFAHGHLLRVLGARWIGLEAVYGGHLALDTGAVCELSFERERRAIWVWNDTSHRR